MIQKSPSVLIVSPSSDPRDASLYTEVMHHSNAELVVPDGGASWSPDLRIRKAATIRSGEYTQMWIRGLGRIISETKPDLIHIHNEPWAITSVRALRTRIPTVLHGVESVFTSAPLRYRIRRTGMKWALRACAGYINWGHTGMEAALRAGLPANTPRAVISASPPDPQVFAERPVALTTSVKVVFVGRLVAEKGVQTVISAAGTPARRDRLQLTIVGEGPERPRLEELARQLRVRARFVGKLDAAGAHDAIAASDLMVVPSIDSPVWSEQWGRVVVEAMMTGRSVLASDAGELPYLVDHPEWIFRQGDARSLGLRLDELLDDPSLLVSRGQQALARSRLFHPPVLARQLMAFWDEVLESRSEGSSRRMRE